MNTVSRTRQSRKRVSPSGDKIALKTAVLLLTTVVSSGCTSLLGEVIVSAPNRVWPWATTAKRAPASRQMLGITQEIRVPVGPPNATLAVSLIEPSDFSAPKATILVLHGVWDHSFWMLGTGRMLAEHGYRAVLVDLRGHGRSSGTTMTYGPQEAADLSQVVDELERRNLIAGPLGIYGLSFGAATSIQFAGHDPRIQAVVAVAPFSKMRDVVPDFGRTILPGVNQFLSEDHLADAVDEAGKRGAFDPDHSDAIAAIQRTSAPVLILHGTDDWLVPPYHALRLYEAARNHASLVLVPRTGHLEIWFDADGEVARQTRRWFDQHLAASQKS